MKKKSASDFLKIFSKIFFLGENKSLNRRLKVSLFLGHPGPLRDPDYLLIKSHPIAGKRRNARPFAKKESQSVPGAGLYLSATLGSVGREGYQPNFCEKLV